MRIPEWALPRPLTSALALAIGLATPGCSGSSDDPPTLSFDPELAQLHGEAIGELPVPLRLSAAVDYAISIDVRVLPSSSAEEGVDFHVASPVVIPAGATGASLVLEVVPDSLYEVAERIELELSSSSAVQLERTRLARDIANDDPIPDLRFVTLGSELCESSEAFDIELSLSAVSGETAFAEIQASGSAVPGSDFVVLGDRVEILPGQTRFMSRVLIYDDAIVQGPRTLRLELAGGVDVRAEGRIDLVILDDEEARVVAFTHGSAAVAEGESAVAGLHLASALADDVVIPLLVSGSAGSFDHGPLPSTVTIPAGNTSAEIVLHSLDDPTDEYDETLRLTLGAPSGGAVLGNDREFLMTIVDDDEPPVVALVGAPGPVVELGEDAGSYAVQVALDVASGKEVSVPFALTGAARGPEDIEPPFNGEMSLTIPAGRRVVPIDIVLVDDFEPEDDEDLVVELRPDPTHAVLGQARFMEFLILDNDVEPDVAFLAEQASNPDRGLFITDVAGTRAVRISDAPAGGIETFRRSPDGKWIAFVADLGGLGGNALYLIDARGGESTPFSPAEGAPGGGSGQEVGAFAWSPDSKRVAYVARDGAGGDELFVFNVLSRHVARLFGGVVDAFQWEPRHSGPSYPARLAYSAATDVASPRRLLVSSPDGTERWTLTGSAQEVDSDERGPAFHWAPDASTVAFRARTGSSQRYELHAVLPDGTERRRLSGAFTHAGGHVGEVAWSPDSAAVAFRANRADPERFEVFVADPGEVDSAASLSNETGSRQAKAFAWQPWEPGDNSSPSLAYVSDKAPSGRDDLWVVSADGSDELNVSSAGATGESVEQDFAWSPNGGRLAFRQTSPSGDSVALYSVKIDGTMKRRLSQAPSPGQRVASFAWAPDESRVAFLVRIGGPGSPLELFSAPRDRENEFVLLSGTPVAGGGVAELRWQGDSEGLVYRADERTDELYELFATDAEDPTGVALSGEAIGGAGVASGFDVR